MTEQAPIKKKPGKLTTLAIIVLVTAIVYSLSQAGIQWLSRKTAVTWIETYKRQNGEYPANLSETGLPSEHLLYERTSDGYFSLYQNLKPWPAIYSYDVFERKWIGGLYYGLSIHFSDFFSSKCRLASQRGDYETAEETADLYVSLANFVHPSLRAIKGEALFWLGYIQKIRGDYDAAFRSFQKAEKIFIVTRFRDTITGLSFANQFGELYLQYRQGEKSESYFQRTLTFAADNPNFQGALIAQAYAGRGAAYALQKNYENSFKDYEKALALYQQLKDADYTVAIAGSIHGLASAYTSAGDYAKAEVLFEKAQVLWARLLPKSRIYLSTLKQDMAVMEFQRKNYDKAEELTKEAIGMLEDGLDNNVIWSFTGDMNLLGNILWKKEKRKEAIEIYKSLLDRLDSVEASTSLYFAPLTNLAQMYLEMKSYDEAVSTWKEALEMAEAGKEDYPDSYIQILLKLAETYAGMGKSAEAKDTFEKADDFSKDKHIVKVTKERLKEVSLLIHSSKSKENKL